jgi:hypothetical protein
MNDRVAGRAAAHTTPTDLAVRDWLLVGLSFTAGTYEAICRITRTCTHQSCSGSERPSSSPSPEWS